ncbi:ATP-binding protein [Spirosoma litoris]
MNAWSSIGEQYRIWSSLFFFCLLLQLQAKAQAPVTQLPATQATKPTPIVFQYLVDTTDQLSIEQLANSQLHWKSPIDQSLILGFTTHPVWCRFTLTQATDTTRNYALELTNFYVDSLTLYQPDSLKGWHVQYSGDWIPFAQRTPPTRYPSIYISESGKSPQTFYARILSSQHHSYQWRVWDRATFVTNRLPDIERYVMFTLATMLALFQVAMLLFMHQYIVLRSYAIFAFSICLSVLFATGFSGVFFPHSPYWTHTSHYVTVGLLLPTLAYYVIQAFQLRQYMPRLVWLYVVFGTIGLFYAILSFFVRHPYITWALVATLAIMLGFTLSLLLVLYLRKIRPAIWNVLAMVVTLPIYTYFYGRNAGFFTGSLSEETIGLIMFVSFASEPFFVVLMLWQATRERINTTNVLQLEQAHRENIQALDRLKTDFFTNVSHELRTPITLLLGPLQTLHSRFPDNELYALMHRNANRLQTLINQLLDLAKLDAHQVKNSPSPGNLTDDIRVWVALFDALAQSRSVTLSLRQNQVHWATLYDADKVEKIVTNLLSNAIKHTSAGGLVEVDAIYSPTNVTITVRDTGEGMPPEVLSHLFDRFYQASGSQWKDMGTGVGLALTYELVQLLGGTITVNSRPNEGSSFCVILPIPQGTDLLFPNENDQSNKSSATHQPIQEASVTPETLLLSEADPYLDSPDTQTDKPLLLLVEDNDDLRAYVRLILAPHYTLLEASDGQQGLEMALDALPDLIVTDLMMPQLDGLDMCRALRADTRTDHIPLVMLTAKASVQNRLIGFETGADDYLTKPFLPAELLVRLLNLRRRQATQQAYWQRLFASSVSQAEPIAPEEVEVVSQPLPNTSPFIKNLYAILEQHLDQSDFDVDQLADALAMSSRNLNRKLKALLGFNTRETIRHYRLRRGNDMLEQGSQPTQVAYAVGFGSLSSFGRAYKEQYGYAPSAKKHNA